MVVVRKQIVVHPHESPANNPKKSPNIQRLPSGKAPPSKKTGNKKADAMPKNAVAKPPH